MSICRNWKLLALALFAGGLIIAGFSCGHDLQMPTSIHNDNPENPPEPEISDGIRIKIETIEDQLQGHYSYVRVTKEAGSEDLLGFDFLIAYDASALTFMGATPGVLFDMTGLYQWEYFNYRFGSSGDCGDDCPSGLLRVVGIYEQNDGPHHALETTVPDGTVLFTLDFLVSNNRELECQFIPVRFYWVDCIDNTIAYHPSTSQNPYEFSTCISRYLWEPGDPLDVAHSIAGDTAMPSCFGAQDSCVKDNDSLGMKTLRYADFVNGGVGIICADSIDVHGDINLNGIPYEIGDATLLQDALICGTSVFIFNLEGQIQASDANRDGLSLTLSDLVYLIRIITNDLDTTSNPDPDRLALFSRNGQSIYLLAPESLGAILFTFRGEAEFAPGEKTLNIGLESCFRDGFSRVILSSYEAGKAIESGEVLKVSNTAALVSIEVVDYNGRIVNSNYSTHTPPEFALLQNIPNPFADSTAFIVALPDSSYLEIRINDVIGRQATSFSGLYGPGWHTFIWYASTFPRGLYFCSAIAGRYHSTIIANKL